MLVLLLILLFALYLGKSNYKLYGGSHPAPAEPRVKFQYPFKSPWEFYQQPYFLYREPHLMSKEMYYRYSVPNYYTKFNRDYYGDMNIVR